MNRPTSETIEFGEFSLDVARRALLRRGVEVHLRPKSFDVLCTLAARPGELVTRDELFETVWGRRNVTSDSITQCIVDVRRALVDDDHTIVRTVPRRGFMFEPPDPEQPIAVATAAPLRGHFTAIVAIATVLIVAFIWIAVRDVPDSSTGGTTAPGNSIAVLRFADMSQDGDHAYFADGLAEEILHELAQSPDLQVTARTSSFAFSSGNATAAEVGSALGVAYILEGSVRRAGEAARVSAQLIDVATDNHVWSRSYDAVFEDVLDTQREIAADVAAALRASMVEPEPASAAVTEAHDLFVRARFLFHRRAPGDLDAAERHLERAIELDPGHARALTMLAGIVWRHIGTETGTRLQSLTNAAQLLERAVAIDPGLGEAWFRYTYTLAMLGDFARSRQAAKQAFAVAPDDPMTWQLQANIARMQGDLDAAIKFDKRVVNANPLSAPLRANLGTWLLGTGRIDEGLEELYRTREISPQMTAVNELIALALLASGQEEAALSSLDGIKPGSGADKLLAAIQSHAESPAAWQRLEKDASLLGQLRRAEVHACRNNADNAFDELDAFLDRHQRLPRSEPDYILYDWVYASPCIAMLHSDERWSAIVDRIRKTVFEPWAGGESW